MAHVEKFTKAAAGHMFKHYERAKDENGEYIKFGNQSIDAAKSHLNYNLAPERNMSQGDFVKKRCTEDGVRCMNRKDVNVMCSWIVTVPRTLPEDEHEKFFKEAYNFLSARYGEENVVSAHVHMDESQPHIHFAFVPVIADKKRGGFKVSAKELIGKNELLRFHPDLSKHMTVAFGYDIGIENGATALGNQTVEQLKAGSEVLENLHNKIESKSATLEKIENKQTELIQETILLNTEINKNHDVIKEQAEQLESGKSELDKIAKKKVDIKAVDDIESKSAIFGDKVTISTKDFNDLKATTKKQIASVKTTKKLKTENVELKEQVKSLSVENENLKQLSKASIQVKMENSKLKKKLTALENTLARVMEFLEKLGLKRQLELFLNPPERQRESKSNQQEL